MKVLIIGSGGREHALAWRLAQSPSVTEVIASPGNPGMQKLGRCLKPLSDQPADWLRLAGEAGADLTVVGPEAPLVAGVVDCFLAAGKRIVGPTAANARLEGSKIFAKSFFAQHALPTAAFQTTTTSAEASEVFQTTEYPVVIKADGLAAGKGVVIAQSRVEAEKAAVALGPKLVIEEFLKGDEVSFIVLSDGNSVVPMEPCQDHKAAFDDDRGPNTGGMGAYSDSRILTAADHERIMAEIIHPTIAATGFTGFLYAGLMMTRDGPKLLEFNVRLGDPETQPLMHRLQSDWGEALLAASERRLGGVTLRWNPEPSVCVVLASAGYPSNVHSGIPIGGLEAASSTGAQVFQAGTRHGPGGLETAGGRVLGVTARGSDLRHAIANAYAGVSCIHFEGMQYRTDIGRKGLRHYNE